MTVEARLMQYFVDEVAPTIYLPEETALMEKEWCDNDEDGRR